MLSVWYVTEIYKKQIHAALCTILGTGGAGMIKKTLSCSAEMDWYLQFDSNSNSVGKFTVWHTKVQLKLKRLKKKADLLIEWPT